MTEQATAEATKTKRPPPEVKKVQMEDGREVDFVGKAKLKKSYTEGDNGVTAKFDLVNGKSYSITIGGAHPLVAKLVGHGLVQKIGDSTAGVDDPDDMAVGIEQLIARLSAGEWGVERQAGDSVAGAHVVIRAIMEATGKDAEFVKAFLEKKLSDSKAAADAAGDGRKPLSRQALYASFRAPGTKTAPIIERLEAEKTKKAAAVSADDELEAMMQ